jgi:hypothetical protein
VTPSMFGGLVGVGVVGLAILILLFREVLREIRDWNYPECVMCGRRGTRAEALVRGWLAVDAYPVWEVRKEERQPFRGRRFTPPWLCPECALEGLRPELLLEPKDER